MKSIRTVLTWGLISLLMQMGFLFYLERQINPGKAAVAQPPVIVQLSVKLPQSHVANLQASFGKDYLAYSDDQGLKVFNLKTNKVVFAKNKPLKGKILGYHWLPDRNTLLYVTARPNPNPPVQQPKVQSKPKSYVSEGEDPKVKQEVKPQVNSVPQTVYNSQLTELYAVDFAKPDEDTPPDSKLGRKLDNFPAGAAIQSMDVSTFTNLIYLQVSTGRAQIVYEIDVMKNIRTVQRYGEKVERIVVSDKKGTLYLQSVVGNVAQIVAVKHGRREQVLRGSQYVLLGVADAKLYLGEQTDNRLTRIVSIPDSDTPDLETEPVVEWSGDVPWHNYAVFTDNNFLSLFDQTSALVFENWRQRTVDFKGTENYPTNDGREVMEVSPNPDGTVQVLFQPL